jgi:hypothetical protein
MTGLIRKATVLTFCGLLVAGAAMAGVPSATTSTIPPGHIFGAVIGAGGSPGARVNAGGVPNAFFQFSITVRDLATNVVSGSNVKIDFSQCKRLYLGQDQPFMGAPSNCGTHVVSVLSGPTGIATFRIVAGSNNTGVLLGENDAIGCVQIIADNVALGRVNIATPDEDNSSSGGAMSGADLGLVIDDVAHCLNDPGAPFYLGRSDFDFNNVTDGVDIGEEIDFVGNIKFNAADNLKTCSDLGHTCCALLP